MFEKSLFSIFLLLAFFVSILHFRHGDCMDDDDHEAEVCILSNSSSFAQTEGTHFVMNGKPFYINGFNAYWMMYMASDPSTKAAVTSAFQQASKCGMNVARIWGFNDDDDNRPLQTSPGSYNEVTFKGLDFVISEAKKYGVLVLLSFVNNYDDFGGKRQYVQWARDLGQTISSDDDFFKNDIVKGFYKNHIKTTLTRVNSITNVAYKDDPTIFAWELMNEPRCKLDFCGALFQQWVTEMAAHVKSIDNAHLLEIGLEGFYGQMTPEKKLFNPPYQEFGTDFIANNLIPQIDFATIHIYAENWLPRESSSEEAQAAFVDKWVQAHTEDCNKIVKKPLILAEFGKSSRLPGYTLQKRDTYFAKIYSDIFKSASSGGSCVGGLFWQLLAPGMASFGDGYEVVLDESPSTASVISRQSQKLVGLMKKMTSSTTHHLPNVTIMVVQMPLET